MSLFRSLLKGSSCNNKSIIRSFGKFNYKLSIDGTKDIDNNISEFKEDIKLNILNSKSNESISIENEKKIKSGMDMTPKEVVEE